MNAVKVTLSTGKVVILREMRISDTELAVQEVSKRAGGDQHVLAIMTQKALLKNLLLRIDDKPVDAVQREDLDSLFTLPEYYQLAGVIGKLNGGDDTGKEPTLEVVSSGDN